MWLSAHKNFVDENHGHVLADDLKAIKNSKLRKLVSRGSKVNESISIKLNKCKRETEISLDSSIKQIISVIPKVTMEEFVEWKIKILQELDSKIFFCQQKDFFSVFWTQ